VSTHSRFRGKAGKENEFGAFYAPQNTSGGRKYSSFMDYYSEHGTPYNRQVASDYRKVAETKAGWVHSLL